MLLWQSAAGGFGSQAGRSRIVVSALGEIGQGRLADLGATW
jgi:hypothetical protein